MPSSALSGHLWAVEQLKLSSGILPAQGGEEKGRQWQGRTQHSSPLCTYSPAVQGPVRKNPSRLPWLTHVNQLLVFCAAWSMPRSQSFSSSSQEPLGIGKQWHHEACSLDDALWRKSPYIWLWSKRNSRVQVVPCMAGLWAWLEVCPYAKG